MCDHDSRRAIRKRAGSSALFEDEVSLFQIFDQIVLLFDLLLQTLDSACVIPGGADFLGAEMQLINVAAAHTASVQRRMARPPVPQFLLCRPAFMKTSCSPDVR
jgi:hypothetical protein